MLKHMEPQQELFNMDELAEYLRQFNEDGEPNRQAIYWMRYRGEGPPAIRLGGRRGRLLFRRADVDRWLESRAEQAVS
jgi:hypothetical protein